MRGIRMVRDSRDCSEIARESRAIIIIFALKCVRRRL